MCSGTHTCTRAHTHTYLCFYFNLRCQPFINFLHEALLLLPCLHSNAIATPHLPSPWLELNPPSHTSPSVISGWEDCPSENLTRWLAVAAQTCIASAPLQMVTSGWRTSVGMQTSVYLDRNPTKGRSLSLKDNWRGSLRGFDLNLFLPLIAKWWSVPTAHAHIHHLRATCINPLTESFIALTPRHPHTSAVMYNM